MERIHGKRHLIAQFAHLFNLFDSLVLPRGCFKIHAFTEAVANLESGIQQRQARRI